MGIPPIPAEQEPAQRCRRPIVSIGAAVLLAAMLAVISLAGADGEEAEARPNLVVIMTDDQTTESLRVMETVQDEIGSEGARFDRAYVNFPLCCPSRATFLTGQYAHNHGVLDNEPPAGGFERFEDLHGEDNLATWLDGAGYRTALVGKYFNGYADDGVGFVPPGWDEWYGAVAPAQHVYDYGLNENGEVVHYGGDVADFKQDVLTERAVDVIEESAGDGAPLFLDLAYTAPHAAGASPQPPGNCKVSPKPAPRHAHAFDDEPLPRPPSFDEANVRDKPFGVRKRPPLGPGSVERMTRRYRCTLESLQSVDEGAGEVLDALRRTGELDDTIVVFTSDNGFFYGEHRITGGKLRHYEEATRVPLLIRGPGIEPGTEVTSPVINADLAPTLLDAAGVEPPRELDGVSLLPVAAGEAAGADRDLLLESRHYAGVHTKRWSYVEHGAGKSRELYDLAADPFELHNLIGRAAYADVAAELGGRLDELRDCAGSGCR